MGKKGQKVGHWRGEKNLRYNSVKSWFQSLEESAIGRGKTFTKSARVSRMRALAEYLEFTGMNPDELLSKAKIDAKDAMQRLTGFFNWLMGKPEQGVKPRERKLAWNAACTLQAYLRGFYTHNDLHFPKRFKTPRRKVSAVSKRDAKSPVFSYDEDTDEIIYKNGVLQNFISNLSFRDMTIALCLLSTGADSADLLSLDVGFTKDPKGAISTVKRFIWHDNRKKDGIEFKTYFSAEATQFLKRYVEQERANAEDKAPLFVKEDGKRLGSHALAINFRTGASKFLKVESNESNPFRPKRLRHLFRSAAANAHVDQGYIEAMMGHATSISASYLEKSDALFLREYVKFEPHVTVFGIEKNGLTELSEEITALRTELSQRKDEMLEMQKTQNQTIQAMKRNYDAELSGHVASIAMLKQKLGIPLTDKEKKALPLVDTSSMTENE